MPAPRVIIQQAELVDTALLKVDGQNPNRMTQQQRSALSRSIERYGFIVPIITNRDLLIADGEQRLEAAKAMGMKQVSVIRLPVEDVDRRLLRQVLNKLRGEHLRELDVEEFKRIIAQGREGDLKQLILIHDDKLKALLDTEQNIQLENTFEVVVTCTDERHQEETYNRLVGEGYRCRVLTL